MTKKEAERPALAPGDVAPDFTLAASDGQTYRLADMLGAGRVIVVAWFPKAFTGG
jgi:thioredoxin-dependent peroxiredoxin